MWDLLEQVWYVPLVMLLVTVVLSVVWVFCMLKQARATLIASAVVAEVLLGIILVLLWAQEGMDIQVPLFIALLMVAVGVYYVKFWSKLPLAASCITNACKAVFEECSILTACLAALAMFVVYAFVWVYGMMSSPMVLEYNCMTGVGNPSWVDSGRQFSALSFWFTTFFLMNVSSISCATGVAGWYFKDSNPPSSPGWTGFKWSFTTCLPGNAAATLVMYVIMRIRRMSTGVWMNCTTCGMCYCLWCCVGKCFETLTRFALIGYVYLGGGFFRSARPQFDMMKSVLGDGLVSNFFAQFALELALKLFAVAVGMCAWVWIDGAQDVGVFGDTSGLVLVILCLLMYICVSNPLLTIIFCCLVGNAVKCDDCYRGSDEWTLIGATVSFLSAAFIGSISFVVFDFVKRTVLGCIDAIFMCYAMEKMQKGPTQERFTEFYKTVEQVVAGTPVGPTATATPAMQTMQVTCPEGATAGQSIQVKSPSGALIQVTVPQGVTEGGTFAVQCPA
jgi:hypothetical protein